MTLSPGSRIGPYAVSSKIGEGGMGEVYRTHDTKLDRDVAIKVLRELFAADPERLERFGREARTLAAFIIRTSRRSTASSSARRRS